MCISMGFIAHEDSPESSVHRFGVRSLGIGRRRGARMVYRRARTFYHSRGPGIPNESPELGDETVRQVPEVIQHMTLHMTLHMRLHG